VTATASGHPVKSRMAALLDHRLDQLSQKGKHFNNQIGGLQQSLTRAIASAVLNFC
jgi:hypothetical protein